jgi:hypothetical protein
VIKLIDQQPLAALGAHSLGSIHPLHKDAGNAASGVTDRVIGKIEERLLRLLPLMPHQ